MPERCECLLSKLSSLQITSTMGVFCEVCNVTVPSEVVMKDHVKGKKHLRMADIVDRQKRQAERSVFVRGFSYGTKEVTLQRLFSNYGPVDLVFIDRERGSYAIVEFRSRDAVETLLQPGHACYLGQKKLTIKPREVKAYVPKKKPEQLPQAEEEESTPIPEVPKYDLEATLSELQSVEDICAQMRVMREKFKLTEEDIKQREQICQDLENIASKVFTDCKANQFGSSVNGFGMRGCDMDIFLDLNLTQTPKQAEEPDKQKPYELPFTKDIKTLRVQGGKITQESLRSASWRDRIKLLGRILGNSPQFGKNVVTIPSARCPVVKVTHQTNGMKCDISINNRMALRNTIFLQVLGQEERLGPLAYTIKIWAKLKDLTGQGPRLTSYTLTLLIIFYLQRTSPPVFPSVKELARMTLPFEAVTLEHWECSFPKKLPPTENESSVEDLLRGFFEFYSQFDFNTHMINIRDGIAEDLNTFRIKALSSSSLETFKFGPVCVQDPFVLDHNTTLNVNVKVKSRLVAEFQEAAAKIGHAKFTDKSSDEWGVLFLLSKQKIRHCTLDEDIFVGSLAFSQMPYMFEIIYQPLWSSDYLKDITDPQERLEIWANRICSTYKKVLSDALLFEPLPASSCDSVVSDSKCKQVQTRASHPSPVKANEELMSASNQAETQEDALSKDSSETAATKDDSAAVNVTVNQSEIVGNPETAAKKEPELESQMKGVEESNGKSEIEESKVMDDMKNISRGSSNEHISTKRSLSHESAMVASESKKSRSDAGGDNSDEQDDPPEAFLTSADDEATTESERSRVKDFNENDNEKSKIANRDASENASRAPESSVIKVSDWSSNIPREDCEHVLHNGRYVTHHRMWSGRKRVKSKVRVTDPYLDLIDLEVKVTNELKECEDLQSKDVVLSFETFAVLHKDCGQNELRFYLQPLSSSKEFTCFYAFLRSYFQKISEKLF